MTVSEFKEYVPNSSRQQTNKAVRLLQNKLKELGLGDNDSIVINYSILNHIRNAKITKLQSRKELVAYIEEVENYQKNLVSKYKKHKPTIEKRTYTINELLQGITDLKTIIENIPYSEYLGSIDTYNYSNSIYKHISSLQRSITVIHNKANREKT